MTKIITEKQKGSTNRHWKNFLDKNYLGSHNLEPGEEMLLTISRFEGEEEVQTPDGKKIKQVLYFVEDVPKMIMNITNGNTIEMLYGAHPDDWIGKQIQVHVASVKAFGKTQDALRVRDFKPKPQIKLNDIIAQLEVATNLDELASLWKKLPLAVKSDQDVINFKDQLKAKLTK